MASPRGNLGSRPKKRLSASGLAPSIQTGWDRPEYFTAAHDLVYVYYDSVASKKSVVKS